MSSDNDKWHQFFATPGFDLGTRDIAVNFQQMLRLCHHSSSINTKWNIEVTSCAECGCQLQSLTKTSNMRRAQCRHGSVPKGADIMVSLLINHPPTNSRNCSLSMDIKKQNHNRWTVNKILLFCAVHSKFEWAQTMTSEINYCSKTKCLKKELKHWSKQSWFQTQSIKTIEAETNLGCQIELTHHD